MPYPQQAPSLERIPSHPTLISETVSSSYVLRNVSQLWWCIGGGNDIAPSGVDPKLYQIVKRITSYTPSLLISSSSSLPGTMQSIMYYFRSNLLLLVTIINRSHMNNYCVHELIIIIQEVRLPANHTTTTSQAVASLVLEKHREYRRKELDWVRKGC